MKKGFLIASIVLLLIISYVVLGILVPAGVFKTIEPHFEGSIEKIKLPVAGPEDITIDQPSGIAFISADDRRANMTSPGSVRGAIFILNLNDSSKAIIDITPDEPADFHPHGISIWREADGRMFLFVINHRQNFPAHVVERYEWENGELIHLESISDPELMSSPNDLVAVGERSFYVSNDHYYSNKGLGRTLEDYLQRAIAYVNYFDGSTFRKVAEGIAYPNGMAVSADQSKIFVAATTGRKLLIYNRDVSTGSLTLQEEIPLNSGVDNIELDEKGNLWIGSHPQLLKFTAHASNPEKFSPSQVLKLSPQASGKYKVEEIFLNDGTQYSGASVAAIYQNTMLIGSVFEDSILLCKFSTN
jgi:arylesterase / paraoxonase